MDVREVPGEPFRRHPWEVARCRFFRRVLARAGLLAGRALDVGAGDAWVAEELARASGGELAVTCWDAAYGDAVSHAASAVVEKTSRRPDGRFDLLLLLDVLEHVEDDAGFLGELARGSLRPGGHALVSVPAWQALFGRHDVGLRHHRRYAPRALDRLLAGAGLTRLTGGGMFGSLIAPRVAMNVVDRLRGRAADGTPPPLVWRHGELSARAVEAALAADGWIAGAAARLGVWLPGLTEWRLLRRG
jgi:SAM-dependent methyltransferase